MNWRPTSTIETLRKRSELLSSVRGFFAEREFIEVQTPVLSRDTVVDRHLDPIVVSATNCQAQNAIEQPPGTEGDAERLEFYLQTSPEFAMKRLLCAEVPALYQIGPAFRAAEYGPMHNLEFTMLEWYRAGDDMQAGMELLSDLVRTVTPWTAIDVSSYQDAFLEHANCDPLADDLGKLMEAATEACDVAESFSDDRDDWLNLLFSECVQPKLGKGKPCIIHGYPASQSALAKLSANDSRTAERFELFIGGVELANGYHELTDASELRSRNKRVNSERVQDGKPHLPEESKLLAAMGDGMPASSGCALGFDRLLMVLLGAKDIREVLAFPFDRC
ncbi:MAG: EF-P lysine aminoacylase EpmA [Planctomycetota bacterium]